MNPRHIFETHYRSADVLLRVYRLLESEGGPKRDHALLPQLRQLIQCHDEEELILILNQLFIGVVRDQAEMNLAFFRKDNLDLLLRQSVVAACSALDTFVPTLLETHLPDVIRIKQRNFMPNDKDAREHLKDFAFKLEDIWPLLEEPDLNNRLNSLTRRILDHFGSKTLSNEAGIAGVMALVGVENPWTKIAERIGEKEQPLREKIRKVVSRRNDIVHRADRSRLDPRGPVQPIDYTWTQSNVSVVRAVAFACCDLAEERMVELIPASDESVEA